MRIPLPIKENLKSLEIEINHNHLNGVINYSLVINNVYVCRLNSDQILPIYLAFCDPGGEERLKAAQGVVDVIDVISRKAKADIPCIVQQISELSKISFEDEGRMVEDVSNCDFFF